MSNLNDIVIVGAGQSGGWAAKTLRDNGFTGKVVLIGNESHMPYERPPLSKGVLLGELEPAACQLWPAERFAELGIETVLNQHVERLDRAAGEVVCRSGQSFAYDQLLLATGSRPRPLNCAGSELAGVHYLRTIDDCLGIRSELCPDARLVIIGGGWIGLEVAAVLHASGIQVTLLEASDQLCGRSLPPSLSRYFLEQHRARGVDIRLGASLQGLVGRDRVEGVALHDGTVLAATLVVVGIGAIPNDELARECGLVVGNGIVVDEHCRTSDARIFACGDVTDQLIGASRMRLESWKNAQDQGVAAAKAMLGIPPAAKEPPWFWSDQFDINFQLLGLVPAGARQYRKANAGGTGFIDYFLHDERLMAAAAINSPRELREAKRAIQKAQPFSAEGLTLIECNAPEGQEKQV